MATAGHPERVKVHDFIDPVLGKANPYGVYDVGASWLSGSDRAPPCTGNATPESSAEYLRMAPGAMPRWTPDTTSG